MHAALARLLLPTRNARNRGWLLEGLNKDAPVHVIANWQSEEGQDRRRYIQQRRSINSFVLPNVRALHANYAKRPVLHSRTCWFVGNPGGAQMIGMKAVI